jgi:hypothetical protein
VELPKNFPIFYVTRRFVTVFTTVDANKCIETRNDGKIDRSGVLHNKGLGDRNRSLSVIRAPTKSWSFGGFGVVVRNSL